MAKKVTTKADVFDVASDLIEQNGSTTTLDIKKEMRNRGFFALQADVSSLMIDICDEEDWSFTFNGVHRVYSDAPVAKSTNTAPQQTGNNSSALRNAAGQGQQSNVIPQTQHAATGKSHTKRSGKVITAFADASEAKGGDWKAYSVIDPAEYYFPSVYTRDDVRLAYRAFCNIYDISDVRACRI